jgi:hypothetical protein
VQFVLLFFSCSSAATFLLRQKPHGTWRLLLIAAFRKHGVVVVETRWENKKEQEGGGVGEEHEVRRALAFISSTLAIASFSAQRKA